MRVQHHSQSRIKRKLSPRLPLRAEYHRLMADVRRKDVTTPCEKCGAAMVVVRVWPLPEDQDLELHMFKCEICSASAFFRFKKPVEK